MYQIAVGSYRFPIAIPYFYFISNKETRVFLHTILLIKNFVVMKRIMKSDTHSYLVKVSNLYQEERKYRKFVVLTLFSLFGCALTPAIGQTVTYNYDASGNVISKVVVQPVNTAGIRSVKDTASFSTNLLAYMPYRTTFNPELTTTAVVKEPAKSLDGTNGKGTKVNTPVVASLSTDSRASRSATDKKKESIHN